MAGTSHAPRPTVPAPEQATRLDSWKEIAAYFKRDVRTIQRWEATEGMPVHRHPHLQRNSVFAYPGELDRWWLNHQSGGTEAKGASWRRRWFAGALGAAGVAALLFGIIPSEPKLVQSSPLTGAPGLESLPAFSPDGTRVAYLWQPPGAKTADVYVKELAGGEAAPLTQTPEWSESTPAWSPDGRWIAFFGVREGGLYVLAVPSGGGAERRVFDHPWGACPQAPGLAWAGGGRLLIAPVSEGQNHLCSLHAVSWETGMRWKLMQAPAGASDILPEVSPDGRRLAFMRVKSFGNLRQVLLARLSEKGEVEGEPSLLPGIGDEVERFSWAANNHEILFSTAYAAAGATPGFFTIRAGRTAGPRLLLPVPGVQFLEGRLSPDGSKLAFWAVQTASTGFWRFPLRGGGRQEAHGVEVPSSSGLDLNVALAPDGLRFAYASNRGGGREIWVSRLDGSAPRRITRTQGAKCGSPRWSPDGERIAYDAAHEDGQDVFVTRGAEAPLRLTKHPAEDFNPSWSADGRWLYFTSMRTGEYQIWKVPAGGGEERQVTFRGGFGGVDSPDGQYFYYTTAYSGGELRRVPAWGGQEEMVYPRVREVHDLRASASALYFLEPCARCDQREEPYTLLRYGFPAGPVEPAASFRTRVRMGFDVARDDSLILVNGLRPRGPASRNILLMEGVR